MHTKKEFMKLSADFKECRDVLVALGDENRLHILYQMMIGCKQEIVVQMVDEKIAVLQNRKG